MTFEEHLQYLYFKYILLGLTEMEALKLASQEIQDVLAGKKHPSDDVAEA